MGVRAAQAHAHIVRGATARRPRADRLARGREWPMHWAAALLVVAAFAAGGALIRPFAADLAYRRAVAAAGVANLDEAEARVRRAIAWTPQDAYLHQFLGEIYYRKAVFRRQQRQVYLDAALVELGRAARLNPYEVDAFTLMGWTELHRGDAPAAETAFMRAKQLDPNNPYVRYSLGTADLWQKKLSEARAEMEFARRYFPLAAEVRIAIQEIDRLEGAQQP
jgi:Flp pilus assembly protein TadD